MLYGTHQTVLSQNIISSDRTVLQRPQKVIEVRFTALICSTDTTAFATKITAMTDIFENTAATLIGRFLHSFLVME